MNCSTASSMPSKTHTPQLSTIHFPLSTFSSQLPKFVLAPLHGITNYHFRNCLKRHVGGFDMAVTPFLAVQETAKLNVRKWPDIQPENNVGLEVIPQLIGNVPTHFTDTIRELQKLGYRRFNWNIGCPSAQVVRKQRGCGIMPFPERVEAVVKAVTEQTDCAFSVKMRLGWKSAAEGLEIVERLNAYPLDFIAIHPRLGVQEYEGVPDLTAFGEMYRRTRQRVIYSGDIFDLASYRQLMEAFPDLQSVMLGRGMLRNIFLAEELTAGHPLAEDEKRERFAAFYDDFAQTMVAARGEHGTLSLLKELWHYFAVFFQLSEEELRGLLRINEYAEFQGRAKEWTKGERVRI